MIFLVRHGERADNCEVEKQNIVNPSDPHLTPTGCTQALQAGKSIQQEIQAYSCVDIQSSPFLRCIMTAKIIASHINKEEVSLKTEICETLYPHFFSKNPLPELVINTDPTLTYFTGITLIDQQSNQNEIYPETLENVTNRIMSYVQQLLKTIEPEQCVILITHQRPLKTILELFNQNTDNVGYCKVISLRKGESTQIEECELKIY
ncbi:unnamed protein product (macronuclear) [Paramecium tetraurelia]|uniref:Phosphoglycerate mutase family protein n=1 Tax=Paramecium tetraurelia TaxID=5888 RepID=A0CNU0_PARTE|nr:uncharacterized protein GSPATT00008899001 [Paramecium tetraurelia]CAK72457.1 unnamed protein product [Paramecium tetraurelia]|eukprot:XP_001439854.1 hypothetical protein (macronuclear) [Paramecium tetraurelia strain d4-2]